MKTAFPFAFWKGSSAYNPAVLALTGWWQAGNYTPATPIWNGTASAGSSGSNSLGTASGFSAPPSGASLNGHATVAFTRASMQALEGAALSTYFSTGSAWTLSALVKANTMSSDNGGSNVYQNDSIAGCASAAYFGQVLRTSGADLYAYSGGYIDAESGAISTGIW